tara:strand:+ start:163 stop:807 length:645 start_codon:yes stop_codon:yes gene_type:complete
MIYIDVVNNVMRRMRENEVANITETTFSTMVGDFVNDAKDLVESAWDWSALRQTLIVPTVNDVVSYSLVGSQDNLKMLDIINDTSNLFLEYRPQMWFKNAYYISPPPSGSPTFYTFNGVDANGDTQIDVYPKPDGVYSLRVSAVIRKGLLVNNQDRIYVPSTPVIHLANALLARERGETGGTSAAEYFSIANQYLSDAIALDAAKHPEETVWYS